MDFFLVAILFFVAVVFFSKSVENLENLKEQCYLTFLDNLNDNFKSKSPKTGPFRGSCDDKINTLLQLTALDEEYSNLHKKTNEFESDPCVAVSNYLCTFTHPNMFLSETSMPPKWLMSSLKNIPPPTHTNLQCFATNYNCCKQSQTIKKNKEK